MDSDGVFLLQQGPSGPKGQKGEPQYIPGDLTVSFLPSSSSAFLRSVTSSSSSSFSLSSSSPFIL